MTTRNFETQQLQRLGRDEMKTTPERGSTILEVAIATMVLSVAALMSMTMTLSGTALDAVNRENVMATEAAQQVLEQMKSASFQELFGLYNANVADDPNGAGTALGSRFLVRLGRQSQNLGQIIPSYANVNGIGSIQAGGGNSPATSGMNMVEVMDVDIEFPTNGAGDLDETVGPIGQGAPTDLNGDGATTPGSRNADYKILPARITVRWSGLQGNRSLSFIKVFTKSH